MNITLSEELVQRVINTLKELDVRGFDSMDRVVGLVTMFENIRAQARQFAIQQAEEAKKKAAEAGEDAAPKEE